MASGTRLPAVAGAFYPADPQQLTLIMRSYLKGAKKLSDKKIKALILPHAGYIYSGQTAAWGFRQLNSKPGRHFVLIGPSHHEYFLGLAGSADKFWQTPLGQCRQLKALNRFTDKKSVLHQPEHCLEVQLPLLQHLFKDKFSITSFLTGKLNPQTAATQLLKHYPKSIFLISSDLSHYLAEPRANKIDSATIKAIEALDNQYFEFNDNVACGSVAIQILLNLARQQRWQAKLICYDTSATASGDKTAVVGYTAIGFYE